MKKPIALIVIALIVIAGIFFYLFFRMGTSDTKTLTDFPIAYNHYDQAFSDYSKAMMTSPYAPTLGDLEHQADDALGVLHTKASARISSLTKNDGELMNVMQELATLSGKELDALETYQKGITDKNSNLDQLAKEVSDLTSQRQAAYTRFLELSGLNQ